MDKNALILLILILVIAALFRLWQLDKIPPGFYPDEAINGNEAISNPGKIFYPENNGREGLFINLIAFSFSIFGTSILALKIVPAIIGILTVLGLYLLTKELFIKHSEKCSRCVALLSSFFLAVSFWHVNFSRIGFRAILLPFILVFSFYFLIKGFRNKKILNFILSGIFFGLGFYTYISFRFAVLILPAILIPFWFIYKKENFQKKFLLSTLYFLLSALIIALPIAIYFLKNPQHFIGRATPISIFAVENPIKEFGKSLILHLGMFNFYGDSNWRHNFAGSPQLFWLLGILFFIGVILTFKEIFRKSNYQNKKYKLLSTFYFLLSTFFIMLLPGILTFEGIPHSLRVIGTIPVVYIFVGLGGWKIYRFFEQNSKRKKLLLSTVIFFLIAIGFSEFDKYFLDWGKNPKVEGAFTKRFVKAGYFLNNLPDDVQKYVIVNESGVSVPWPDGIPMPAQTIMFIQATSDKRQVTRYLLPENLDQVKIKEEKAVIVPMKYDQNLLNEFSKRFPEGKIEEKEEVFIYKINF